MAALTLRGVLGTKATLMSTDMDGLVNNTLAISSVLAGTGIYNNTAGSSASATTGDGYKRGLLALNLVALGAAPTANSTIDVWLLKSIDGTNANFEDGGPTITPQRAPDQSFLLDSSRATAEHQEFELQIPQTYFKTLIRNNASGQTLGTGNTLTLIPVTDQAS